MRLILALTLAVLGANAHPAAAQSPPSKLDSRLQSWSAGTVRVIIGTDQDHIGAVTGALQRRGRSALRTFTAIHAVVAEVSADDLAALAADPDVSSISIDAPVASLGASSSTSAPDAGTLLGTLGLPTRGLTGRGVGVAVIDSGLALNGDFSGVSFYDFTSSAASGPYDEYGHGTHVSGLIASKGSLSQGAYTGIAPKARVVSLKVLDAHGAGSTSTVIAAIEFAIANKSALGIDVINLSLGHPIYEPSSSDPLVQSVEAAVRAGIVVVASAGNVGRSPSTGQVGYAGILSPGNAPSAITVGALDTRHTVTRADDLVAPYSSRGPTWYDAAAKPDLVAPGQSLISDAAVGSVLYANLPGAQVTTDGSVSRFLRLSGTSMSAAVTSGVAALMIQAARDTFGVSPSPSAVKAILAYTALPLNGPDALTQGHGALNAAGAIALTLAAGNSGAPLTASTISIAPTTTIGAETWTWAQEADSGDTVVWGNTGDGAEPAWAQTVVWGNVEWGDTVVWGNSDGDTVVWGNTDDVN